jgi:hypothetical protein
MLYPEFGQYNSFEEPTNSLIHGYQDDQGHIFYVEPGFYDQLQGLQTKDRDGYAKVLKEIYHEIKVNPKLIFTVNFEQPFFEKEDFIYREIEDVTNAVDVYFEDKCRGSDYGD